MALNIFIKIDGIKGESQNKMHKDEIDVLSWNWGLGHAGSPQAGTTGGASAGKVTVQDLSITKRTDIATPPLMLSCANGKHFKQALLTVCKEGEKSFEFLRIKINEVLVTSISTSYSIDGTITENVIFNFSKVEVDYVRQKPDGTAGESSEFNWDVLANKPL
jgi:type VI secretion system secreted protein Hcp